MRPGLYLCHRSGAREKLHHRPAEPRQIFGIPNLSFFPPNPGFLLCLKVEMLGTKSTVNVVYTSSHTHFSCIMLVTLSPVSAQRGAEPGERDPLWPGWPPARRASEQITPEGCCFPLHSHLALCGLQHRPLVANCALMQHPANNSHQFFNHITPW